MNCGISEESKGFDQVLGCIYIVERKGKALVERDPIGIVWLWVLNFRFSNYFVSTVSIFFMLHVCVNGRWV